MLKNQNAWPKIAIGILICELAGILGALWTSSAVRDWYPTLIKPAWTPPSWVFGPVWTVLYAMMGIAVGLIWAKGLHSSREKRSFIWFWSQLALNVAWTAVFFGARAPGWGYVVIILLWLAIAATIWLFSKISRVAALLLVPYFGWVTFASALNFSILTFNVMRPKVQQMDKDPRNKFTRPYREAPKLRRGE
ncbi:MAG TPA: TspO/MBR family protein [Abditibacterium sp.]|jgi:tryptophan-rich sensory protein